MSREKHSQTSFNKSHCPGFSSDLWDIQFASQGSVHVVSQSQLILFSCWFCYPLERSITEVCRLYRSTPKKRVVIFFLKPQTVYKDGQNRSRVNVSPSGGWLLVLTLQAFGFNFTERHAAVIIFPSFYTVCVSDQSETSLKQTKC